MTARAPVPLDGTVPEALADRVLLQVGYRRAARYRVRVDTSVSGLVLTGDGALTKAGQLREEGFDGALLVDEACYRVEAASDEAPFPSLDNGPLPLFGDPLEHLMLAHLAFADLALTPTGYLHAGAVGALEAAAARVTRLSDPRVVFAVPVDASWLHPGPVGYLAEVLNQVAGPKAVLVGGRPDARGGAAGLARLLEMVPGAGVLRTGLGAFGGLGRGAGFAAFGADASMRHIVPPAPAQVSSGGGPGSPAVLFPELMDFFLGLTLAKRFDGESPGCSCEECQGEPLDRFTSMAQQVPAAGHNASSLMVWARQMRAVEACGRAEWWQQQCRQAVDSSARWNARIQQLPGFTVSPDLSAWAELPVLQAAALHAD
ncbi:hypothetical protein [Streptomyces griseorubiginosus]|uniref:hypothetical protein n=1 Tax=Streptomyces griseorubiginosus TaxID=67304 RepID=UPI00113FDB46|nr:hypothetical protein [Streptomyces griseorubiginosus]